MRAWSRVAFLAASSSGSENRTPERSTRRTSRRICRLTASAEFGGEAASGRRTCWRSWPKSSANGSTIDRPAWTPLQTKNVTPNASIERTGLRPAAHVKRKAKEWDRKVLEKHVSRCFEVLNEYLEQSAKYQGPVRLPSKRIVDVTEK